MLQILESFNSLGNCRNKIRNTLITVLRNKRCATFYLAFTHAEKIRMRNWA